MKKLLIIPFILTALLIGFSGGIYYQKNQTAKEPVINNPENKDLERISVNLMLDYGDGRIKTLNDVKIGPGETVFALTKKISETEKIDFKFKDYGGSMGAFTEAIGGVENDFAKNIFWQYWLNGEYAKVGAGSQFLKAGDAVMWKYVKGQVE